MKYTLYLDGVPSMLGGNFKVLFKSAKALLLNGAYDNARIINAAKKCDYRLRRTPKKGG